MRKRRRSLRRCARGVTFTVARAREEMILEAELPDNAAINRRPSTDPLPPSPPLPSASSATSGGVSASSKRIETEISRTEVHSSSKIGDGREKREGCRVAFQFVDAHSRITEMSIGEDSGVEVDSFPPTRARRHSGMEVRMSMCALLMLRVSDESDANIAGKADVNEGPFSALLVFLQKLGARADARRH
jgi:hypothetical protein